MLVKINNLKFQYAKSTPLILNDLTFEIQKGTINVLLGLNGCGKTTLIKLLAGLLKPIEGNILYDNNDLTNIPIKQRSKIFSYVPQKTNFADDFIVKDYLTYGFLNDLKFYETPKKEQLESVNVIAKKLNIENLLDKKMGEISGGERQIVSIAVSLLQNTEIIYLDEPTSALDLKNQFNVLSLLKEIANEGRTVVLSSHNPNHALYLNSNVILMNKGKIKDEGVAEKIVTKEKLQEIYGKRLCLSKELDYSEISFTQK